MAKDDKGIFIEGYVNAYIGGSIQAQGNGLGGLAYGVDSSNSQTGLGTSALSSRTSLAAGVYNNGTGLTSVGGTPLQTSNFPSLNQPQKIENNLNPTIGLFGGKTGGNTGGYSKDVGPANVQVKLTLVSSSGSNPNG